MSMIEGVRVTVGSEAEASQKYEMAGSRNKPQKADRMSKVNI